MRLAPVPLYFVNDLNEAAKWSEISSRTTHSAKVCIDACRLFGAMIAAATKGMQKEDLLHPEAFDYLWAQDPYMVS